MIYLLFTMLERVGIIVSIAFVLTRLRFFQDMFYQNELRKRQQITALLFFGLFGIIGTYSGLTLNMDTLDFNRGAVHLAEDEAIVNSRVIGVVLAGLLGGYKVGIGAGLIASIHRFFLGGFTAFACGIATVIAGILAGLFHRKNRHVRLSSAFLVGLLAELIQMLVILGVAKPFEEALNLVEVIGIPMMLANGVGAALFLLIIKNVVSEKEKAGAFQAQKTLRIADQTLAYLRTGMTNYTARNVCEILYNELKPSAVAMTNRTRILAHVGMADDHHKENSPLQTEITKTVIQTGELVVANDETIHCVNEHCPLGAAVVAPLKQRGETIGTLKFYFQSKKEITGVIIELISGLSVLLSNQLEVAEADRAHKLVKDAEIKALQAQISPHFLFNSINTIVSLIRIDPKKARKLLISLSQFLRQNLSHTTAELTSLQQELTHVKAYLEIEQARFVDRLHIDYDVDEGVLFKKLPPLTLQPIVENAIKHGFKDKEQDCIIKISIIDADSKIQISVEDNGKGIRSEQIEKIGVKQLDSEKGTGLGLYNVNQRLILKFGKASSLHVESEPLKGTQISFFIPKMEE
ncbi:sensor histidine kinase [Salinibacillus xinjiangensis]|uniref:histidine kinase n=1 Tax=Salinibacillus xinjiangensis TaxID=1229268 RepID=A0A6G1X7J9_9BACI|nr:sensor histidine kinase [Salinibacillus xinjiangensis]MRG86944.1 sensor histidine kinase [Salinibacillus xinjiangensis]